MRATILSPLELLCNTQHYLHHESMIATSVLQLFRPAGEDETLTIDCIFASQVCVNLYNNFKDHIPQILPSH